MRALHRQACGREAGVQEWGRACVRRARQACVRKAGVSERGKCMGELEWQAWREGRELGATVQLLSGRHGVGVRGMAEQRAGNSVFSPYKWRA